MSEFLPITPSEQTRHESISARIRNAYRQCGSTTEFISRAAMLDGIRPLVEDVRMIANFIEPNPIIDSEAGPNKDARSVIAFAEGGVLGLLVAKNLLSTAEFNSLPDFFRALQESVFRRDEICENEAELDATRKAKILAVTDVGQDLTDNYYGLITDYLNNSTVDDDNVDSFCGGFEYVMAAIKLVKDAHQNVLSDYAALVFDQMFTEGGLADIDPEKVKLN